MSNPRPRNLPGPLDTHCTCQTCGKEWMGDKLYNECKSCANPSPFNRNNIYKPVELSIPQNTRQKMLDEGREAQVTLREQKAYERWEEANFEDHWIVECSALEVE